jgi:DNA polymerase III subunit alpha
MIAERCNVDLGFKGYRLPEFPVPDGHTAQTYLRALCEAGMQRRYGSRANDPELPRAVGLRAEDHQRDGLRHLLPDRVGPVPPRHEVGIWYNARGSAAGSIVAYTLDITMVDPIEHELIFERFLNPGRIEMPDIDLDFRDDRRAEMMAYTRQ